MEYLGFWVTHNVVKTISIKIEAITNMLPPTPRRKVKKFIGVINYYSDMCPRRSQKLVPLTKLTSTYRNFKWTKVRQEDFGNSMPTVACDNLLTYPYFNKKFKIYTINSALQLGAVIIQKGKLMALYSRKLNDASK